jgi:hypothetical protein
MLSWALVLCSASALVAPLGRFPARGPTPASAAAVVSEAPFVEPYQLFAKLDPTTSLKAQVLMLGASLDRGNRPRRFVGNR